jgi:uncharacterized membrane protein
MTTNHPQSTRELPQSVLTVAHLVYALHLAAIVGGLVGATTVIGRFLGSLPSTAAVILNDGKRGGRRPRHLGRYPLSLADLHVLIRAAVGAPRLGPDHHDHWCGGGVPILIAFTVWLLDRIGRGCYVCVIDS